MNDSLDTLYSAFSVPSLGDNINSVDLGFDNYNLTANPSNAAPVSSNSGASSTAGVSGFQSVLSTLTSLFNGGVAAYNNIAQKTGLPTANGTPTNPVAAATLQANTPVFAGFTQKQLFLFAAGAGVIALLFFFKRR